MITSKEEYASKLVEIQLMKDENYFAPIPESEKIYQIDLNARSAEAPSALSVTNDHEAEIIYFEVDRFFDMQDILETTCLITYVNAAGEKFVYNVPRYDAVTKAREGKVLIPWVVGQNVTRKAGTVKFAFKFYIIDLHSLEFTYLLHTTPATTRVLQGLDPEYTVATESAAADNTAGKWEQVKNNYFILVNGRYVHPTGAFNSKETYYLLVEEARISDAAKIDAIYQEFKNHNESYTLKWVEV